MGLWANDVWPSRRVFPRAACIVTRRPWSAGTSIRSPGGGKHQRAAVGCRAWWSPRSRHGGAGPGRLCCHGSLGSTTWPTRAARAGKPRGGGHGRRCEPRLPRLRAPGGGLRRPWRTGTRGPRRRSRPCSAPPRLWKAATALWRNSITSSGGYRSSGTRCGRSCITSMVAPQMARRPRLGFSGRGFRTFLKPFYPTSMRCLDLGNENVLLR